MNSALAGLLEEPIASLEDHGVSIRIIEILEVHMGAIWLKDILNKTDNELKQCRHIGDKSCREIVEGIQRLWEEMEDGNGSNPKGKTHVPQVPENVQF